MAQAKKCDRCGKFYEENNVYHRELVSGKTKIDGIAFTCVNGAVIDYTDLCDACIAKVMLFLDGQEIKED